MKKQLRKSTITQAVSAERATRLYRMVTMLGKGPATRPALLKALKLDLRGFYRDLKLLRLVGIHIPLDKGMYVLRQDVAQVLPRLPFPDPRLTLGDAMELAQGRGKSHAALRKQILRITGKPK